jgi:hypothetical protein
VYNGDNDFKQDSALMYDSKPKGREQSTIQLLYSLEKAVGRKFGYPREEERLYGEN